MVADSGIDSRDLDRLADVEFAYWIGERPPIPRLVADRRVLDASSGFRLPPNRKRVFDAVFYVEEALSEAKQWRQILDEMMRLLTVDGLLVVRIHDGGYFTKAELVNAIFMATDGACRLEYEAVSPGAGSVVVGIRMTLPRLPSTIERITFGVVVDGKQPARLQRFVDSVVRASREGPQEIEAEVVVCGPEGCTSHLMPSEVPVRLVVQPDEFAAKGWITRKKNMVIAAAAGDVVVVAHDRYWVESDFVAQLVAFGADFDIVVPQQFTESGSVYPSNVATLGQWDFSALWALEEADAHPNTYVNGGIYVARTELLRRHPFNEMLFWAQAEDVELSRRLVAAGVAIRRCPGLIVRTDLTRSDQVSVFGRVALAPEYVAARKDELYLEGTLVQFEATSRRQDALTREELNKLGISLLGPWTLTPDGARIPSDIMPRPCLAFRALTRSVASREQDWTLHLQFVDSPEVGSVEVYANGLRAELKEVTRTGETARLAFAVHDHPRHEGHEIGFEIVAPGPLVIKSARLLQGGRPSRLPVNLAFTADSLSDSSVVLEGWSQPETWGTWSEGRSAQVSIPLELEGPANLIIVADVVGYLAANGRQAVAVGANGVPTDIWAFRDGRRDSRTTRFMWEDTSSPWLTLSFDVAWPTSPRSVGRGSDGRQLGIALERLTISRELGRRAR